jgi:3-deoxy-manno-octulosonate cytidylyltransferase (CMP-KDO synthetase)
MARRRSALFTFMTCCVPASTETPFGRQRPLDLIVIPARFGSTRLPGKPLIPIMGRTLLERVIDIGRRAAMLAGHAELVVATDDARIEDHAAALGCAVAMTASTIQSGSGRAHAAVCTCTSPPEIVVNLQGDAPFVPPEVVAALIGALRQSAFEVATPVVQLGWPELDLLRDHKRHTPASGTTVTRLADGHALWFSKEIIPQLRDEAGLRARGGLSPIYRHLGVYAYRTETLARFESLPPSPYERLEGLEQLRFLEHGIPVLTVEVAAPHHPMSGIDSAEDVALAGRLIAQLGDPFGL